MGDLAHDTAVEGGDGKYRAHVSRDWEIWGPNGGYIAAIALRAAGEHSRFDRPLSLVGHFLGVAAFEPVDLDVTTLRSAKRAESMRVSMTQQGQPIFEALVWSVGDVEGLEHNIRAASRDARAGVGAERPRARSEAMGETMRFRFWANLDERQHDWIDDWENRTAGDPVFGEWYKFLPQATFDDPWVDACRSVILLDTMGWPAACHLHTRTTFMAPSIDLSVAFHRWRPAEPWLYAQGVSPSASGGIVGCESKVWARDGTLLATGASQLLCRPAPPEFQR